MPLGFGVLSLSVLPRKDTDRYLIDTCDCISLIWHCLLLALCVTLRLSSSHYACSDCDAQQCRIFFLLFFLFSMCGTSCCLDCSLTCSLTVQMLLPGLALSSKHDACQTAGVRICMPCSGACIGSLALCIGSSLQEKQKQRNEHFEWGCVWYTI